MEMYLLINQISHAILLKWINNFVSYKMKYCAAVEKNEWELF